LHLLEEGGIIGLLLGGSVEYLSGSLLSVESRDLDGIGEVLVVGGLEDSGGGGDEDGLFGLLNSRMRTLGADVSALVFATQS